MAKAKIAVSVDRDLLSHLDSKVDGSIIRSRSQAMEFYLKKGLDSENVTNGVILLKGEHQRFCANLVHGKSLIYSQVDLLLKAGVKKMFLVTQRTNDIDMLLNIVAGCGAEVTLIEADAKNNACAVFVLREKLAGANFVVLSGDTYYDFDLANMVRKHNLSGLLAAMGLMTRGSPTKYGNAVLSGDLIVDFAEKPAKATSHVVNAGVYVFKPEVFALLDDGCGRLEESLFPKLAKIKQLLGHFAHGEYLHFSE